MRKNVVFPLIFLAIAVALLLIFRDKIFTPDSSGSPSIRITATSSPGY